MSEVNVELIYCFFGPFKSSPPKPTFGCDFLQEIMSDSEFKVIAPARVVLFGEHQDYLGLPVISAAVNLFLGIEGKLQQTANYDIDFLDLGSKLTFSATPIRYQGPRDYFRAGVKVLQDEGIISKSHGVKARLSSQIPIQAGLSSSTALNIAWILFLCVSVDHVLDPLELALLAHKAEVLEFNEPGGMQDHLAISHGFLNFEEFYPEVRCTRLAEKLPGIVVGNSLEEKDTLYTLAAIKGKVQKALRFLGINRVNEVSMEVLETIKQKNKDVSDAIRILQASLDNFEITKRAYKEFCKSPDSRNRNQIGYFMLKHHVSLRDQLEISTPKIEALISAAMSAGALGCKITGSGNGGCMIAYSPGKELEVSQAIERAGGEAYIVNITEGAKRVA